MNSTPKPAYLSCTLWSNIILAVAALAVPSTSEYLTAHPDILVGTFTIVNMLLRFATKEGVTLW